MRLPSLTTSPPMMEGSTFTLSATSLPVTDFSAVFERVEILVTELFGDGDVGRGLALELGHQRAERADHIGDREQPAVGGQNFQEFGGDAADPGLVEHGGERLATARRP